MKYAGIDENYYSICKALETFPEEEFKVLSLFDLEYKNEFNFVSLITVMQHINNCHNNEIAKILNSVLKTEGYLIISEALVGTQTSTQLSREDLLELFIINGFKFVNSWYSSIEGFDEFFIFKKN